MAEYDPNSRTVACVSCVEELASGALHISDVSGVTDGTPATALDVNSAPEVFVGTPGASAQREFERRKSKRERRIRAAHPLVGGLVLALSDDPQSTRAWATGARGEERVGRLLDGLAGPGIGVLHDRRIPGSRANIDHIAVAPSGVFVIDAKKYNGRPALRVDGGFFRPRTERLFVGSRDCTKLVDGVQGQIDQVVAALAAAGIDRIPVVGMLCFVDADWPVFGGDFSIDGFRVLWPRKAASVVREPGNVDMATVDRVHRALASTFPPA